MNKKKSPIEYNYYHPIRSIFNKKPNKTKGGSGKLGDNITEDALEATYEPPKGLVGDEFKQAMLDIEKGYNWLMSNIDPKDDVAKKRDYESLSQQYISRE